MKPEPVTIRGVTYPSVGAAARAFDCHRANITHAKRLGYLDRVGLGPSKDRRRDDKGRYAK